MMYVGVRRSGNVVDMQWECIHTCGVSLGFEVLSVIRSADKRRLHYQEKAAEWILQDATIVVVEWLAAGV